MKEDVYEVVGYGWGGKDSQHSELWTGSNNRFKGCVGIRNDLQDLDSMSKIRRRVSRFVWYLIFTNMKAQWSVDVSSRGEVESRGNGVIGSILEAYIVVNHDVATGWVFHSSNKTIAESHLQRWGYPPFWVLLSISTYFRYLFPPTPRVPCGYHICLTDIPSLQARTPTNVSYRMADLINRAVTTTRNWNTCRRWWDGLNHTYLPESQ